MTLQSLKHADYSDLDLLGIINDLKNEEGFATTRDIADQLGVTGKRRNNCVGVRFSYMRRQGWIERGEIQGETAWRLTPEGETFRVGKLKKGAQNVLTKMSDGEVLQVLRFAGQRSVRASQSASTLMRREFTYQRYSRNGR